MNTNTTIDMTDAADVIRETSEVDENNINKTDDMSPSDMNDLTLHEQPGAHLALLREKQGHSAEYIASKLHLRVCIIELLEADDYESMPEPVFIKGYLRAYANLLGIASEPLLRAFNQLHVKTGREQERALWQTRRPTNNVEHVARWATGAFALVVLAAVVWWWSKSKDVETMFSTHVHQADAVSSQQDSDVRLTDLSNMRTLLSPNTNSTSQPLLELNK